MSHSLESDRRWLREQELSGPQLNQHHSSRQKATLEEITSGSRRSGLKCWRQRLTDPEVKQLMTMVDEAVRAGQDVNAALLSNRLLARFNLDIKPSSVQRHVHRRCKCWGES